MKLKDIIDALNNPDYLDGTDELKDKILDIEVVFHTYNEEDMTLLSTYITIGDKEPILNVDIG